MVRALVASLAITTFSATFLGCGSDPEVAGSSGQPAEPKCTPGEMAPCNCAGTASTGICGASEKVLQCECGVGTPGEPQVISVSSASAIEVEDHLAVTRDGVIATAWISISGFGSPGGIGYTVSQDRGATWSAPVVTETDPSRPDISDPVLASDGKNLYLGWMAFRRVGQGTSITNMAIKVAKLGPGETTFGEPVIVGTSATGGDKPWMGVTKSGAVVISYMTSDSSGQNANLNMAKSTDEGASWTVNVVHRTAGNFIVPCVSANSDRVWVAYIDFARGSRVFARWSDDDGDTWPVNNTKALTEIPVVQPASCMAHGENVFVAFPYIKNLQSQEQPGEEYHVVSYNGTGSPTEVNASGGTTKATHLGLMVPEDIPGAMTLLYYGGKSNPDPNGFVYMTRSTDDGATWSESVPISGQLTFTTNRAGPEWLGDYMGGAQLGNELLVAYGDNSQKTQNLNVTHIAFVKVSRP